VVHVNCEYFNALLCLNLLSILAFLLVSKIGSFPVVDADEVVTDGMPINRGFLRLEGTERHGGGKVGEDEESAGR